MVKHAAAVSLLVAGAAFGQSTTSSVQLQLRIVPQTGTLPGAITDSATSATISAVGQSRRFEVQYRILDLDTSDSIVPADLSSGSLRILALGPTNLRLAPATLSRYEAQLAGASPPPSNDTSGAQTGANAPPHEAAGLHRPFRTAIPTGGTNPPPPNNEHPANGVISPFGIAIDNIVPLALSQSDQGNVNAGQADTFWYGLYSFTVTAWTQGAGTSTLSATFVPDRTSEMRFNFFSDGNPAPLVSANVVPGTFVQDVGITFPAPASAAVLFSAAAASGLRRRAGLGTPGRHGRVFL